MPTALCLKCAGWKADILEACPRCGFVPASEQEKVCSHIYSMLGMTAEGLERHAGDGVAHPLPEPPANLIQKWRERLGRRDSQNNVQASSVKISYPRSGYLSFSDMPAVILQKLKERIAHSCHYELSDRTISGCYNRIAFMCVVLCIILATMFMADYQWEINERFFSLMVSAIAALTLGINVQAILKWDKAPLQHRLLLTPLYVVVTGTDGVHFWPLRDLQGMEVIHHYINGCYQKSEAKLLFSKMLQKVMLCSEDAIKDFRMNLSLYEKRLNDAYTHQNFGFIGKEDDFYEAPPQSSEIAGMSLRDVWNIPSIITVLVVALALSIAYVLNLQLPPRSSIPPQSRTVLPISQGSENAHAKAAPTMVEHPIPANGQGAYYAVTAPVVPLAITAAIGSNHYYIRVEDWNTRLPVRDFFLRSGQSFRTYLPVGIYRVKLAEGKVWHGTRLLFGEETAYQTLGDKGSDEEFDLTNPAVGTSVKLIMQKNGNLHSHTITPSEW